MDALAALTHLQRLELCGNRLTSLASLSGLCCLTQLSTEDNALASLDGMEGMSSLMELYAGNNMVQELKVSEPLLVESATTPLVPVTTAAKTWCAKHCPDAIVFHCNYYWVVFCCAVIGSKGGLHHIACDQP